MLLENTILEKLAIACKKAGYKQIIVNKRSVSAYPDFWEANLPDGEDGWPAIWSILEKLAIGYGCGNGHQHQAKIDIAPYEALFDVIPELKKLDCLEAFPTENKQGLVLDLENLKYIDNTIIDILYGDLRNEK